MLHAGTPVPVHSEHVAALHRPEGPRLRMLTQRRLAVRAVAEEVKPAARDDEDVGVGGGDGVPGDPPRLASVPGTRVDLLRVICWGPLFFASRTISGGSTCGF